MDGVSQDLSLHNTQPLDFNYNSLQLADYEAAMLSLLEMSSMDSEGASSHLPFLPPVEREVPVPPFIWPTPYVRPTPHMPLAFQPDAGLHGSQPPVTIKTLTHTQAPTPPASQPPPLAPATPRPTGPSTVAPDTAIPVPEAQPPVRIEALGPTPPATSQAPEMPRPPLAGSQTDPVVLGPQPPVTIEAPAHTPSAMPIPPAPPASQKAPASEPCAPSASEPTPALSVSSVSATEPLLLTVSQLIDHHVEDEQPGAWRTGRARQSVPFNRHELDNDIGDAPRRSGQVGGGTSATSKRGSKRNAENTGNASKKLVSLNFCRLPSLSSRLED
ncbi:uncharacterized protein EDB91DRAFT_1249424 [Suillus paluster]|uniref:uncharacterized protein n=1 Tax=Suillus paluster TaxID=48578 RepID=UPI001B8870C2|nr:uncharacterized protein EDB91DRAFT_1249424 [Suillus paluster]KAG1738110.1 hypothetical protein EDB91DRAFT_1249424 [Suillus paluster]